MSVLIFLLVYAGCGIFGSWVLMRFLNAGGNTGCMLGNDDLIMIYFVMPLLWFFFLPILLLVWGHLILSQRRAKTNKLSWPRRLYDKVNGNV